MTGSIGNNSYEVGALYVQMPLKAKSFYPGTCAFVCFYIYKFLNICCNVNIIWIPTNKAVNNCIGKTDEN